MLTALDEAEMGGSGSLAPKDLLQLWCRTRVGDSAGPMAAVMGDERLRVALLGLGSVCELLLRGEYTAVSNDSPAASDCHA